MHAIDSLSRITAPSVPFLDAVTSRPFVRQAWRLAAVAGLGLSLLTVSGCQTQKECCDGCGDDKTPADPAAVAPEGTPTDATAMGDAKPADGNPAEGEAKPQEVKMAELTPAAPAGTPEAAKPADAKVAEATPADAKPVAVKPAKKAATAPAPVAAATENKGEGRTIVEQYAALGYRQEWVGYAPVQPGAQTAFAVPLGNLLIVQDSQNAIAGINTATGASKWSLLVGDSTTAFVGHIRYNNRILAISDADIFALEPESGEIVGKQHLSGVVSTAPAVVGSTLVFGTVNKQAFAHNLLNGQRMWGYITGSSVMSKPAVLNDNCVGIVAQNGNVLILDALSGTSTGKAKISGGMLSDPVASGETLYVASEDQSIYAFERIGGKQKWRVRTDAPISAQPTLDGNRMYLTFASSGLHALDTKNGKDIWVCEKASGNIVGVRTGTGGDRLIVWNGTNLQTVDTKNGDLVESIALSDVAKLVTDKYKDGAIYTVSAKGKVTKLIPR